jgi:sulfite reductase (ferredoxin)
LTFFLLGHDDCQDFGRKFKVSFSGCKHEACGMAGFHDIGCIAVEREINGKLERGFEYYVGGGLGSVPHPAKLLSDFVHERELLPLSQAVCRVFGRLGEKDNRSRARLKFLVNKLGIEEFKRLVLAERELLRPDPRWTEYLGEVHARDEEPLRPGVELPPGPRPDGFEQWRASNVRPQRQSGYSAVTITLPLGDFTPEQGRALADLGRKYTGGALRATATQNLVMRWVSNGDLVAVYQALVENGLGESGADTVSDITSCPGTDTCKLGISSSRGLASELRRSLRVLNGELDPAAKSMVIKCSGCFNSCGQHHVADLGFLGVSRSVNGRRVPHFQLVVGGQMTDNAFSFGLAIGAVPSKRVPDAVKRLTSDYVAGKKDGETYRQYITRVGKKHIRAIVDEFVNLPTYDEDPSFYSDWGDPREYTTGDMGIGECAGEVVPFVQMGLAASEREIFEAQLLLDDGKTADAARRAYAAMIQAARALTREKNANIGDDADEIVREFRTHFHDTKLFHDPYAGGKFAQYLFRVHEEGLGDPSAQAAHHLIEEAQLFVDAAHQCYMRMTPASA